MVDPGRAKRLAERIKVIVAETLERGIKDPRLGMVTVTDVRLTGDLHDATVFYTVFGSEDDRAASAAALESARGLLRSEVGRRTGVRFTPTLTFTLDAMPESAKHIDDLLAVAHQADAAAAAARAGANYAGDPDPYKKPAGDEPAADQPAGDD
jgi:ribosome-binding factor A